MRKAGFLKVLNQNSLQFQKNWIPTILLMLLEPTIYLSVFGFGVGKYISEINGLSYLEYFFIGYIVLTAAVVSFSDCFLTQQSRLYTEKIYSTWLLAPLSKIDIFLGEIIWSTLKGVLASIISIFVGVLFGIQIGILMLPMLLVLVLLAFLFACAGSVAAVSNFRNQYYGVHAIVLLIATLFISGVLFPVESLSLPFLVISYLMPLTHAVLFSHILLSGKFDYFMIIHFGYLLVISYLLFKFSFKFFKNKITN